MIGKVVNYRYEILEKAGDGSLYSVYKARDKVLNRLVAVKILQSNYAANQDFAERITAEVQSVQDLVHPNIARIYEAESQDGLYFTALEFVRGINLKDRIRRTAPFTISYAVDIAIATCEALDYAHRTGVVHGDIRPHNILTSPEGQVKITDFGVAAAVGAFPQLRDNTILRSVHYTAPEVLKGKNPSAQSDIYSLGVVLFEMVTGSVPFDADTAMAIAAKHLEDQPPLPHELNTAVPKKLSEVILRAMDKNPATRYQSVAEMLADLQRIKDSFRTGAAVQNMGRENTVAKPAEAAYDMDEQPEPDMRHSLFMLLGVFVLAVVLAAGFMFVFTKTHPPSIQVPDLVGKRVEDADAIARQLGIQLVQYHEDYNDRYDAGEIYMTDPAGGGMVRKDDPKVKVWVSKGKKLSGIPDIVGLSQDEAIRRLSDAGFVVGRISQEYSDNAESGQVISQSPRAGENKEPLSSIDMTVSKGANPEPTPPDDTGTSSDTTVKQKQFDVKINVPSDMPDPQVIKIVVSDEAGDDRVVFEEPRHPGESFTHQVIGFGDNINISVYAGDTVLLRKTY